MVEMFGKQTSTALSSSRNAPQWQSVRIRVLIAPSCALLHSLADLDEEKHLDGELRGWLAFSKQKLEEIAVLERGLVTGSSCDPGNPRNKPHGAGEEERIAQNSRRHR
jgi:hypothetical protein